MPHSFTIFCEVVDNFGDIGVCWRLARQLSLEHGMAVTLWVDALQSFQRLCPAVDPTISTQEVQGVRIRHWNAAHDFNAADAQDDVIIEAFGCHLPDAFIAAMAARLRKPVWINLEYLSAEAWVDGCHTMPSPHPALPLTKYFFFPGFTRATGGLLAGTDLRARREGFQSDAVLQRDFLSQLGVTHADDAWKVSLFCYPHAPVSELFNMLTQADRPVICMVPEGVASAAVEGFFGRRAKRGDMARSGALRLHIIPFVDQDDYDRLLWSCDLNFVRGEDSFVRAQWAARPFVWQIYPQAEQAHLVKLDAFLDRYLERVATDVEPVVRQGFHVWNADLPEDDAVPNSPRATMHALDQMRRALPAWNPHAAAWTDVLLQNGDLAANLIGFAEKIG